MGTRRILSAGILSGIDVPSNSRRLHADDIAIILVKLFVSASES
jgi:hypothetical protein